jgi:hypothetical protein
LTQLFMRFRFMYLVRSWVADGDRP